MTTARAERPALSVVSPVPADSPWRFVDDVEVLDLPRPDWLVDGMLECHSTAEVYGQPESFKSFFTLDLALSVATGSRFLGRATSQGAVLYVCGEGIGGLPPRVDAWKHQHELYRRAGVYFTTNAVNLLMPEDVASFIRGAQTLGVAVSLVVFDTLARCIPGGDENRQQDMGIAVRSLDLIRQQLHGHPTTLVVHHTPRGADTSRGSNSLDGAMETQILLKRDGESITVTCEKQKNAERFTPIALRRELIQESVVLITAPQLTPGNRPIPGDFRHQALRSLHDTSLDDGLSTSQWLKVSGLKERTFYEARKFLVAGGYVVAGRKRGDPNRITPLGTETITANCNVTAR